MKGNEFSEVFTNLKWHRLSVNVLNIRTSSSMKAHPLVIFQSIIKGISSQITLSEEGHIIFHLKNKKYTYKIKQGDIINLEILFTGYSKETVSYWREALLQYFSDSENGKNYHIERLGEVEERYLEKIIAEIGEIPSEGELCLEFLTPLSFKREKNKNRIFLSKTEFIKLFEKRFSKIFGINLQYSSDTDEFSVLPYYWNYTEIRHHSKSQPGHIQYINGCVGKLYIKGRFAEFLPFLILGSELHAGTKIPNGVGYYHLHKNSLPFFDTFFPQKTSIVSVVREVMEKYDNATESLSIYSKIPFNEDQFANELLKDIITDTYTPVPHTAFLIKKKNKTDRLVEQLNLRDLIVQQYILKTITPFFDRIFEESSIGFRKGISREKSIELVKSALSEGFQYVIESDIEDFFPSIDIAKLMYLIDFYLPQKDVSLRNLIFKFLRNGYILNGRYYERTKGVAQGAPLSPILANLYLDSFDEFIQSLGVRLVRYADDFIILTKTKEDAENILSNTEVYLSELGLKLKKEKTAIKHIKEGFSFLGMKFTRTDVVYDAEQEFRKLKKPLYITEPYLFLSLNGEAIDMKKEGKVIETIPLRRVSEIIVMEKTTFSTSLIKKCTEMNIPLTITLSSGYYITTIKPDSKKYYDISFEHARKYSSLTETEHLSIAKEFAAGKIKNYISLFRQRYIKDLHLFISELERAVEEIYQTADINAVRGHEGAITRKIYAQLNCFIDDEAFHIKKRQRYNPDRINSLLNLGYYLLFSRINATVRAVGLNPYLGFLHSPEDNYESLVCDIQELFRAHIDRFIIRLINLKVIIPDDFVETERGFILKRDVVKLFLNHFEAEMDRKGKGKNSLSLKENIYAQTMIIKNYLLEDKPLSFYHWQI